MKTKIKTWRVAEALTKFLQACDRGDYGKDKAEDRGRRLAVHEIANALHLPADPYQLERLYWDGLRDDE